MVEVVIETMRTIRYYANTKGIHQHYCAQRGGSIPVFIGNPIQRGSGLGRLLSGLVKSALPILKKTVLPAVVKSGREVLSDVVVKKKGIKQALLDSGSKRIDELFSPKAPVTGNKAKKRARPASTAGGKKRKL